MPGIEITWKNGASVSFGTMRLPNRVKPALYKMRGSNVDILAYFRNDGCAEEFEKLLDYIVDNMDIHRQEG